MRWQKELEFYMLLLIMKFVNGMIVMTEFAKIFGEGKANIACSSIAGKSADYLAVAVDESNVCTNLNRTWGSSPYYTTGSTYYEKRRVVQIYEPPLVVGGEMKLPITFRAGSYISMYIEFPSDNFDSCSIRLVIGQDDVVISLILQPTADPKYVYFKSRRRTWRNHGSLPFSFAARPSPYNITLKALTDDMQILFDGDVATQYSHRTAQEDARHLLFPNDVGLLLHKIEFVGV